VYLHKPSVFAQTLSPGGSDFNRRPIESPSMPPISVIICSHNPTRAYLERTLASLQAQTLDRSKWELMLVDNNSTQPLSNRWTLSWHPSGRHVREQQPGLTPARVRGIAESRGNLLIFVDDDNVLAADYLERAKALYDANPGLGAFGSGALEPEFETTPPPELGDLLSMLALRTVPAPRFANNRMAMDCIPWGAGLCVRHSVAAEYVHWVKHLDASSLDRRGERLFCGGDDLFSLVACEEGLSFGIFPELRITHLISSRRLTTEYILRLLHDHAYSHAVLKHLLFAESQPTRPLETLRTLLHGARHGSFSMRCRMATVRGIRGAAEMIRKQRLRPIGSAKLRESCRGAKANQQPENLSTASG
jgi:glycosyltransferase involved in cell wall biosynthesis